MTAAKKNSLPSAVEITERQRSGEHAISLDDVIRHSFEQAFESDLQTTSRVPRFDLEEMLSSPEVRPTDVPPPASVRENEAMEQIVDTIVNATPSNAVEAIVRGKFDLESDSAVRVGSLPPPAIEVDRTAEASEASEASETKEEERDP